MAKKPSDVKAQFKAEGVSMTAWAKARGFNVLMVYRVLAGRVKGNRGEAHAIAVALGLKAKPHTRRFASDIAG